jgi:NAD+ kinase
MSSPAITAVGIVAKRGLRAAGDHLGNLGDWLQARRIAAVYESDTAALAGLDEPGLPREGLVREVDLVVVLGGDGTLLGMATQIAVAGLDIPILGVNFGSLGFLTETRIDELYIALESVVAGSAAFDERTLLEAHLVRQGGVADTRVVLNDVVFTKAALSRIIELSVAVGSGPVTTVRADGLIIASATGSTAYNLAAGGPIVHPRVDAIVLTPIAPHTLTHRPIVIPASETIEVRPHISDGADEIFVTYDGQAGYPLQPGDAVHVRAWARRLRLVKAPARTYFEMLREKLKWGAR